MSLLISTAGWLGGLAIVTGYVLLLSQRTTPDARTFLLLNTVGGALLTASAVHSGAWPNTVINVMWLLSGLYALFVQRSHRTLTPAPSEKDDVFPQNQHHASQELVGTR